MQASILNETIMAMDSAIRVNVRYAVLCEGRIFVLDKGEMLGEAVIAAYELSSWMQLDMDGAIRCLQSARASLAIAGATSFQQLFCNLYEQAEDDVWPKSISGFPGNIYLYANGIYAYIDDLSLTVGGVADTFNARSFDLYLLVNGNAGEVWHGLIPSVKFYFHSNEQCGHSVPHVHVDYRHECNAAIAIVGGKCLAGDGYDRVPGKTKREIRKLIEKNERELLTLWNQQTNGVRIDIDATLGKSDGNNYVEKGRQACRHNTRTS